LLNITKATVRNCETTRWRNNAGTTTELFIDSPASSLDKFGWRLSVAEVEEPGVFSSFAGYQRVLSLLTGKGIELIRSERSDRLLPGQALAFDGADTVNSHLLSGPIKDLNIIFDPRAFDCSVQWLKGESVTSRLYAPSSTLLVFCLEGTLSLSEENAQTEHHLAAFEALRVDNSSTAILPLSVSSTAQSHFCLINLTAKHL